MFFIAYFNFKQFLREFYISNILKFGLVNGFSKLISFLIFIILSRHFSLEVLGIFDFYLVFLTLCTTMSILGLDTMIYRYLYDISITITKTQLVSQTFFTQIIICFFICFFIFLINYFFNLNVIFIDSNFIFFSLAVIGMLFYTMCEIILRISVNLNNYIILVILNSVLFLSSTFFSLYVFDLDFTSFLKVFSVTYFFLGLLGFFFIYSLISFKELKFIDLYFLKFAIPIGFLSLLPLIQGYFLRSFIYSFLSEEVLGLYSSGLRLTILYVIPSFAVTNSIIPLLLRKYNEINFSEFANKSLFFILFSMSFCVSILSLYSNSLLVIILNQTDETVSFVFVSACVGLLIQSISGVLSIGSTIKNGTIYRFFTGYFVMFISLLSSYYLVQVFGLAGLICGLVFGNFIQLVLDTIIGQWKFSINWNFSLFSIFFLLSFIFISISFYLSSSSLFVKSCFLIFIIFISILFYFKFVSKFKSLT